jgi:hypothetical protein
MMLVRHKKTGLDDLESQVLPSVLVVQGRKHRSGTFIALRMLFPLMPRVQLTFVLSFNFLLLPSR